MERLALLAVAVVIIPAATADAASTSARLAQVIEQIEALPYQPDYVPVGLDSAFAPTLVPNAAAAQDYTTGSVPGSPDAPAWPMAFVPVTLESADGARLTSMLALHGVATRASSWCTASTRTATSPSFAGQPCSTRTATTCSPPISAIFRRSTPRATAIRIFRRRSAGRNHRTSWRPGRFLERQPGVTRVGVIGFSEGAQNTVLALAQTGTTVFDAGLTFSGPADQNAQIHSTAVPAGCETPNCSYPVTGALIALVVPPYTFNDPCAALAYAGTYYAVDPFDILARESAYRAQTSIKTSLLNFYAADDLLVLPFRGTMMAGYGSETRQTRMVARGAHAYFYDRWWQQQAMLLYFKAMLPAAASRSIDRHDANGQPDAGRCSALHTARESRRADGRASRRVSRAVRLRHQPRLARLLGLLGLIARDARIGSRRIVPVP